MSKSKIHAEEWLGNFQETLMYSYMCYDNKVESNPIECLACLLEYWQGLLASVLLGNRRAIFRELSGSFPDA